MAGFLVILFLVPLTLWLALALFTDKLEAADRLWRIVEFSFAAFLGGVTGYSAAKFT